MPTGTVPTYSPACDQYATARAKFAKATRHEFVPNDIRPCRALAVCLQEKAWTEAGNHYCFSTSGLDAIARNPEARLVIIEPGPPEKLVGSALWRAIPSVKANRVVTIPPTWVFGALPSALRFATILGKALQPA